MFLVGTESGPRRGFTLVELLVVLAILIVLFGLLFAPMMTSLEMARQGQSRAKMQDTVRYAMEDIRRTVGNAIYVLPPHIMYPALYSPGNPTVNPPAADLSMLTVVAPRRDSVTQMLMTPLQPEVKLAPNDPAGAAAKPWIAAVRYVVHPRSGRLVTYQDSTADPALKGQEGHTTSVSEQISSDPYEPDVANPFVLFRQTGIWYRVAAGPPEQWAFGSFDANKIFLADRPISENALTGVDGYDIPCAASVCANCGARTPGFRSYADKCGTCGGQLGYLYQFPDATLSPQRVAGEALKKRDDGVVYTAAHAGWTGYVQSDPTAGAPQLDPRALDPRITVYRYDPTASAYSELQYDSYDPARRGTPALDVAWDNDAGAVRFGHPYDQIVTLTSGGITFAPSRPPDQAAVSSLDANGVTPTGYRIDTYGTTPASNPAIIVPSTVGVRIIVTVGGATARKYWWDLVRTEQYQQSAIGPWQFAVRRSLPPASWAPWVPADWATNVDVLFNNTDPMGPPGVTRFETMFGVGNVSSVEIHLHYWARRNADIFRTAPPSAPSGRDDIVRVDYNTSDAIDAALKVSQFQDYVDDGSGNLTVPPPPPNPRVASLSDTIMVRNAAR